MTRSLVTVNLGAGPIRATGHTTNQGAHQIIMGDSLFIHIDPDTAKQWVAVLETIAAKDNK